MAITKVKAGQVTSKLNATGSTVRGLDDKLAEVVSVKDFGAVGDGVADDTAEINAAAAYCRSNNRALFIPAGTYLVSASLNFSSIHVFGDRNGSLIQATSAQFDVVTTTGNSTFENFKIHGGWDGVTAGQTGNGISVENTVSTWAYNVHFRDLSIQFCKENGIYIAYGGYSSLRSIKCNASGLHGLYLYGLNGSNATTTVSADGACTFSDCPNGYGVKINNCINISLTGLITEYTQGIELSGNDNRNIALYSVYEENIVGNNFVTFTGSGVGLTIVGCFAVGLTLPYSANWTNVLIDGNVGIVENGMYGNGRLLAQDGGEVVVSAAGDYTASSLSIPPGTWLIQGVVQTENAGGAAIDRLCSRLTLTSSDTANTVATNANFVLDADIQLPASIQARTRVERIYQNTSGVNQVMYLRTYIGRTAGSVAYRGYIQATKLA